MTINVGGWANKDLLGIGTEWTPTRNPRVCTASVNVNPLDDMLLCSGAITITLETAVHSDGRWHTIVKTDTGTTTTIACTGSETVGGASTKTLTTQYTVLLVKSDGTNWVAFQTDLATAVGILTTANGGTGNTTGTATINANLTGPVTSVGNATTIVAPTYPLMDYGGLNFNGTTTYLDGNALTGIADGKKGTLVVYLRFANAASAAERIFASSGGAIDFVRLSTGNISFAAENAAGTVILNIATSGTPCASAGTYCIMVSYNLASPGSGRIYVNDVSNYVETTFTNDTIDYTVAEYSLGATVAGADFFAGDMVYFWFDDKDNLEFNTESIRRRFIDSNVVPVFMGSSGELPMTTMPLSFNAYAHGSTAGRAKWPRERGRSTGIYVENGAISSSAQTIKGQQAPISGFYTPTFTNVANLTSTAVLCQYFRDSSHAGGIQIVSGKVNVDPTLTATSTQLGISLPFASAITASANCAGTAAAPGIAGQVAAILGDVTNARAQMQWISADVTAQDMYFQFMVKTL